MGEIADMMIDGTLCQSCGVFMGPGGGYPVSCHRCRKPAVPTTACPACGKKCRGAQGLADHTRAKHTEDSA